MRYLIYGYYGFGNLGDELMLRSLWEGARRRDPKAEFHVRCRNAPDFKAEGLHPFDIEAPRGGRLLPVRAFLYAKNYLWRTMKMIKSVDVLLIGGGTLFIDKGRPSRPLVELLFFAAWAKLKRKKVVLVGVGADTLGHVVSRLCFKALLALADGAWFREFYGYRLAAAVPWAREKVRLTADLTYALSLPAPKEPPTGPRALGLVLADVAHYFGAGPSSDALADAVAAFLSRWLGAGGAPPLFLVFQPGTGFQGDVLSKEVMRRVSPGKEFEMLTATHDNIAEAYGRLDLLVGMHYHALVLASRYGVPFVGIGHERKFAEVCRDFEMPLLPLETVKADALYDACSKLKASGRKPRVTEFMTQLAGRNFDAVAAA